MKKKLVTFMAAAIVTVGVSATTFAGDTFHEFFSGTARINKNHIESTNTFTSSDETHTVRLHPLKIYKTGDVFAYRNKKGIIFEDMTRTYKFNIINTKQYVSDESKKLKGKYYYTLGTYNYEKLQDSGADVVFNQAYVRESK